MPPPYRRYDGAELKLRKPPVRRRPSTTLCYDATFATQHPLLAIGAVLVLAVLAVPVLLAYHAVAHPLAAMTTRAWVSTDTIREAGSGTIRPDVHIKQAWVYGDRMRALGKDAVADAIAVQSRLLAGVKQPQGDGFGYGVHSVIPALNCSNSCLLSDGAIVDAVNRAVRQGSPAGVSLQPNSVLGAPLVRADRLVGADALVITLIGDESVSAASKTWDRNAAALSQDAGRWIVRSGPAPPSAGTGKLIRVLYRSSDFVDDTVFYTLYAVVATYLAWVVGRTTVLKSRAAQLGAIGLELATSVTLSLAIASVVGIDVSTILWKLYPLAVLPQCLRNAIQLLQGIEKASAQAGARRVSAAYSRMGNAPLVASFTHVVIFALLSVDAPSGLAAFCQFAMLAAGVDLAVFMLLTGAASALNVRQLGLEESFAEPTAKKGGGLSAQSLGQPSAPPGRSFYPDAVANTMVLVSALLLVLRFRGGIYLPSRDGVQRLLRSVFTSARLSLGGRHQNSSMAPAAYANTADWLRAQDPSTLGELLRLVRPGATSVVVQTFDPLVVIPQLAKRNVTLSDGLASSALIDTLSRRNVWLPTFALCAGILLALAFWNIFLSQGGDAPPLADDASGTSVRCLPPAHTLDVFLLGSGARRFLVSVGFDREVRLWDFEAPTPKNQLLPCSPGNGVSWPITTVSMDGRAEWVAICSQGGNVSLWNRREERFGMSTSVNGRVVTCAFTRVPSRDRFHDVTTRLLLVLESGGLVDVNIETGEASTAQICNAQVRSAHLGSSPRMPARLITISEHDGIYISTNREGWWSTRPLQFAALDFASPDVQPSMRFSVIPSLRGVGIAYNELRTDLHLVDMFSGTLIYSLQPRSIKFSTLRAFHSPPQACVYCGSTAVASFSIAYTERPDGKEGGDARDGKAGDAFIMTTISAENNPRYRTGLICLRSERDARERRCAGFSSATEVTHAMPDPGAWEATGANGVAGVRKREVAAAGRGGALGLMGMGGGASSGSRPANRKAPTRRRGCAPSPPSSSSPAGASGPGSSGGPEERWEAWTMTAKGSVSSHALTTSLLTSKSGPVCRLARNAVAVGLADMLVLVQFGAHLHDNDDDEGAAVPKPTHHGRLSRQNSRVGRMGA